MNKESIIVEVQVPRNRQLMFEPLNERLRGRWATSEIAGRSMHESLAMLSGVPFIPGIRLEIDPVEKTLTKLDPLGLPEFKSMLQLINKVASDHPVLFGGSAVQPVETAVFSDPKPEVVKRWLYWIRRGVDARKLLVIQGEVPTMEEIRGMPGRCDGIKDLERKDSDARQERAGAGAK